jgi:hypothetical protein
MPANNLSDLTDRQVTQFLEQGFIRMDDALPTDLAETCRAALWAEIGLSPDRPQDWTAPVIRVPFMATQPFVAAANTPRLHRAYNQLVGAGRWVEPRGLGSFPIRFPSPDDPGDDGWHVDVSFGTDHPDFMEWRVNVKSRGRALLMLFLFSDVGTAEAPTRIRVASHRIIARQLLPHGESGLTLRQLSGDGFASTADCDEVLATGPAGTVYLCHPFLVHSAQPHRGTRPRFMAQPPLLPLGEFDPTLPASPLQIAIRQACGLTF